MSGTKINGQTQIKDNSVGSDQVAGSVIVATGVNAFTGNQSMGGNRLTGLATPSGGGDATSKDYVDDSIGAVFTPTQLNDLTVDVLLASVARGDILFRGSSKWNNLAPGTLGKFLRSGGAGADPAWSTDGSSLSALSTTNFAVNVIDVDGTLAANSDTRLPTQKAVKTYADQLIAANDVMVFKGVIDCSSNPNYPAADAGHTYRVSVAGKIGGASGTNVESGDLLLCLTDGSVAGTQASVGSNWSIAETNHDGVVIGPTSAVDSNLSAFNTTTGKLLKDSGIALSVVVTLAGSQSLTNKKLGSLTTNGYVKTSGGDGTLSVDTTLGPANPSASVGLTAVNGSAATFMRSDGAPALDVSITPTWSGLHTFQVNPIITNTTPKLILTDTTTSAKSLTIAVDANVADLRESAGVSGSLLTLDLTNNRVGIGMASPAVSLHVTSTTEQLRLAYDESNTAKFAVSSTGTMVVEPSGSKFIVRSAGGVAGVDEIQISNTGNVSLIQSMDTGGNGSIQLAAGATYTLNLDRSGIGFSIWTTTGAGVVPFNVFGAKISAMSGSVIGWTASSTSAGGSNDTGLARNAAGIVEINTGTAGTFGALRCGAPTSSTIGQIIKGAASQSADLQEWQDSSGNLLLWVTSSGSLRFNNGTLSGTPGNNYSEFAISGNGAIQLTRRNVSSTPAFYFVASATEAFRFDSGVQIGWSSGLPSAASSDTGIGRNAAGVIKITDGSSGLADLLTSQATLTQVVKTSGSPTAFTVTGGAHTTLTASTEATDVNFNLGRTVQFATGALTTQRAVRIQAPTYGFVGASTLTTAVSLEVATPSAGTNATITNSYGVRVIASAAAHTPVVIQGASSQTGHLQEWQDSSGNVNGFVGSGGNTLQLGRTASGGTSGSINFRDTVGANVLSIGAEDTGNNGFIIAAGIRLSPSSGSFTWSYGGGSGTGVIVSMGNRFYRFDITGSQSLELNTSSSGQVKVQNSSAATVPFFIKGASSQSGNLQEWQNSSAGILASVGPAGIFTLGLAGAQTGTLNLKGTTSGTVTLTTAAAAGTWTLTLPSTAGTSGQYLQTDGSGNLSWATGSTIVTATDGATVTLNLDAGSKQKVTIAGNRTLALSGGYDGQVFTLYVNRSGSFTFTTWFSNLKWVGGSAPTQTATSGKWDVFVFTRISSTEYLGNVVGLNY